ncbi:MAG: hypothetical protein WCK41_07100 [Actinomycetes bacterium]
MKTILDLTTKKVDGVALRASTTRVFTTISWSVNVGPTGAYPAHFHADHTAKATRHLTEPPL